MPYIKQDKRKKFKGLNKLVAETPGELNYLVSELLNNYVNKWNLNYQTINDIVGALEGAKIEFYRRLAAPLEDQKVKENGDVYKNE